MSEHAKLLVWTRAEPDAPSGSPLILSSIIESLAPETVEVVCERRAPKSRRRTVSFERRIRRLDVWPFERGYRARELLRRVALPAQLAYGLAQVRRFRPDAILTVLFDNVWVASSLALSALTGVPAIFYAHDAYRHANERAGRLSGWIARKLETRCARAGSLVALTDALRDYYSSSYGVDAVVIRNLVTAPALQTPRERNGDGRRVIGFGGVIYENNRDLLAGLAAVARKLEEHVRLVLFTPQKADFLAAAGIAGPNVECSFEPDRERLLARLAACDLVYLPLAFDPPGDPQREMWRMAFPTKTIDYLIAGAPILVQCPDDYEVHRFLRHHAAAHLLPVPESAALETWLRGWLAEPAADGVSAGMRAALAELDAARNLERLNDLVQSLTGKELALRGAGREMTT
jgi:hypothetical protein